LYINLLGPTTVGTAGTGRPVRAAKVRAMLAALALQPGWAISHTELADELWSDRPPGNPRNALQAHATRVRRVLGPAGPPGGAAALRAVTGGYVLDLPPERVDSNRFLALAGQGAAALPQDAARALELLRGALLLWRGPALLDAGDGLRCRSAAALLEERRLTAWEDLARARMALGDAPGAVAELRQLVARHPLRERLCELLMLALYRSGRQGDALELFRVTRKRLDQELGIEPGATLRRRYTEILAQDPELSGPAALFRGRAEPAPTGC
jgi:DNA-binding SARP family transcriptional activator